MALHPEEDHIQKDPFAEVEEKPLPDLAYSCRLCLQPSDQYQKITPVVQSLIFDCISLKVSSQSFQAFKIDFFRSIIDIFHFLGTY